MAIVIVQCSAQVFISFEVLVRTYAYILFTIWILPLWRLLNYEAHDERVSIYKMEPLTAHLDLVTIS